MGLDTNVLCEGKENDFITKCSAWLKKNKLTPEDVDCRVIPGAEDIKFLGSCHSRLLSGSIAEIDGFIISLPHPKLVFGQDMSAEETLAAGKKSMKLLETAIKKLLEEDPIANKSFITQLEGVKKQALWFIMVGECGFSTTASY